MRTLVASRSTVGISDTAAGGRPSASSAVAKAAAKAWLLRKASLPPRRMAALPLLMHSAAASAVTLGRDS